MGVSVYWPLSVLCVFVCLVCVCVRSNQSTSKKPYYVSDLSKLIVCTPTSFCWEGLSLLPNFQNGGLDRISIFRGGLLGKRGGDFLWGRGCSFYTNLNCEILTKNLVTFKRWDRVKVKYYGGSLKNQIFRRRFMKNQYRFKVWLGKKEEGGVFEGGLIP